MKLPYQLISVFTDEAGNARGNVSAVVWLEQALPPAQMQALASDLNQPATTFCWQQNDTWHLRWFAPDAEIGLCGHGTAAACAAMAMRGEQGPFTFQAGAHHLSGNADAQAQHFHMAIDAIPTTGRIVHNEALEAALGIPVLAHYSTNNKNIVVAHSVEALRKMQPKWHLLRALEPFGYAVTAQADIASEGMHFASRTLVPKVQQLEDHATGSSHAALIPFWAERLHTTSLIARQLSPRGGHFKGSYDGTQVILSGQYTPISEGHVLL